MPDHNLETRRITRSTRFYLPALRDALLTVFGANSVVDIHSKISERWIDITSDTWSSTTTAAIQTVVDAVPGPLTYEASYLTLTTDPAFRALVAWLAEAHAKTVTEVNEELREILNDLK